MATEGTGAAYAAAAGLGQGWKISPSVFIEVGDTFTLAEIEGPGAIQQIWMTLAFGKWRHAIIRMYWDDQEHPSVECPAGDFFANGWEQYAQVSSLAVCVNPGRAFNCYWEMPFRKKARITMTNIGVERLYVYYQINYTLTDVPEDCAYFHAPFRRTNPLPYGDVYTLLDGVSGRGHYVGTYMAWGATTPAGGTRARSSSTWTATARSRPSAAPGPRTTSAAPTTSIRGSWRRTSRGAPSTRSSTPPTRACRR